MSSIHRRFTTQNLRRTPVSSHSFMFVIKPSDFIHLSIAPQFPTTFPNYERYSPQSSFHAYSSRSTTPNISGPTDSRELPPLSIPADRWQPSSYLPQSNGFSGANSIRSPTASYPPAYKTYSSSNQASAYSYHMQQPHDHLASMNPQPHAPSMFDDVSQLDPRSSSPYGRSSGPPHILPPRNYSPPPVSPTSPKEMTMKKKRKRVASARMPVSSRSSTQPTIEQPIHLPRSVLRSQKCLTCLHAAYRYGNPSL